MTQDRFLVDAATERFRGWSLTNLPRPKGGWSLPE